MTRTGILVAAVILAFLGAGAYFGHHQPPANAETTPPPVSDPWARDQMAVLGSLKIRDGLELHAVHVPGWPLGQTCLVLSGPQSTNMTCDTDLVKMPAQDPPTR